MEGKKKAVFNWSTGKDSALALQRSLQEGQDICYLLTTVNSKYKRVSQHGVREVLLQKQANAIGIPLRKIQIPGHINMQTYSNIMREEWKSLQQESINISIFGDIYLEHLREYREQELVQLSIEAQFPLWKVNTNELAREFIDEGFKAVVVSVNSIYLDESYAGRLYDKNFLKDLPGDVDACGEQGEFHTFVYDGPIFNQPVIWEKGEKVFKESTASTSSKNGNSENVCGRKSKKDGAGIWFCDIF